MTAASARQAYARPDPVAYPGELAEREAGLLERRRTTKGLSKGKPGVGLGLSGGGIRSATFALGLLQALARVRALRGVDYLSTVSGGGYIGSFVGRLFARTYVRNADDVEDILCAAEPAAPVGQEDDDHKTRRQAARRCLHLLRDNGNYIAPAGGGDWLSAVACVIRNLLTVHVIVALFLAQFVLAGIMLEQCVRRASWWPGLESHLPAWWSPICNPLWLVAVPLPFVAVSLALAYWLIAEKGRRQPIVLLVAGLSGMGAFLAFMTSTIGFQWAGGITLVTVALALLSLGLAFVLRPDGKGVRDRTVEWLRNRMTAWLGRMLLGLLALAAIAAVDLVGRALYVEMAHDEFLASFGGLGSGIALLAVVRPLLVALAQRGDGNAAGAGKRGLIAASAIILPIVIVVAIIVGVHAFAWWAAVQAPITESMKIPWVDEAQQSPWWSLWWLLLLTVLLNFVVGLAPSFVNYSSLHPFYTARLIRAYLGASNPARLWRANITETRRGDDIEAADYWNQDGAGPSPYDKGAPLHMINVTINETTDSESRRQQQDRKGVGMAVGPCGVSVGVRHHARWCTTRLGDLALEPAELAPPGYRVFAEKETMETLREYLQRDRMTIGRWVSISGAAFSTGTGFRTSLLLSLLAGMANVRLGYWWAPGCRSTQLAGRRAWRQVLHALRPVQINLLAEWFARFPGTSQVRWYLSDGGHFENLAGYELIRRRLPLMIISDAEQDQGGTLEGLAGLVRKARLDFGAEIEFLDASAAREKLGFGEDAKFVGALEDLRPKRGDRGTPARAAAHVAVADVKYADSPDAAPCTLVYIKPGLTGDETVDLLEYQRRNDAFPHESTADQMFGEDQWESYRKLGNHIGSQLFGNTPATRTAIAGRMLGAASNNPA